MKQSDVKAAYELAVEICKDLPDKQGYPLEEALSTISIALAQYDPDSITINKSDVPEGLGEAVDSERSKSRNYIKPTEYALIYKTAALVANAMKESEG
tara:strand:+ start:750 stop:1043 length:294 start_codon:yes stop_codon:yes gene_type:complete